MKILIGCCSALILLGTFCATLAYSGTLPVGSYINSCNNCSVFNNTLTCECQSRKGRVKVSSVYLNRNCISVENDNGQLRCTGTPSPDDGRRGKIFEVPTQSIWNQFDAQRLCQGVCDSNGGKWTGNWRSLAKGQASLCECRKHKHRDDFGGINIRF